MHRLETENGMHRIQPQAIESIILQPHQGIVDHEAAHAVAVVAVEINGVPPGGLHAIRKVGGESGQIISIRAEMVVHHIEKHGQTMPVTGGDQARQVLRRSIRRQRGVPIDAVIAPAMPARECRHRQQFHMRHAQSDEMGQFFLSGLVGSFRRERAHVQLVNHGLAQRARPKRGGIDVPQFRDVDELRTAVYAVRLPTRARIRHR